MKKFLCFVAVLFLIIPVSAQITSTFDANADGWTFSSNGTPITVNHNASNGNPGGYAATAPYAATTGASSQGWFAPAKFLGQQALRSYGMNLRFDLQQAFAGTNSATSGDVRIGIPGFYIVFSLPVKPAVAPAWSSYAIKLDETAGWRVTATNGALATQADIVRVLSNMASLEIRGTYINNAANVVGIDNVILEQKILAPAPTITAFSPMSGIPGASVTINGNNFGATSAQNVVYFGTTKATIVTANAIQLVVTIPAGAKFGPITVINLTTGLSKQSSQSFSPRFDNNKDFGGRIIPSSLDLKDDINLPAGNGGITGLDLGDLDGDGLVDIIATEIKSSPTAYQELLVFRNLGVTGDINASSFGAKIVLGQGANDCIVVDLDGDGKLDIVGQYSASSVSYFITYRNISTPGTIAFEAPESFVDDGQVGALHVADLDGDGRPDLMGTHPSVGLFSYFYIAQNLSVPGDILIGAEVAPHPIITSSREISTGDLTGDGKLDIAVSNGGAFRLFHNQSTPGTITLAPPVLIDPTNNVTNVEIADLDNDGKLDLSWASGVAASAVRIRKNIYTGGVLDASSFDPEVVIVSPAFVPNNLTASDINGDGKLDFVTTNVLNLGIFENVFSGTLNANSFLPPVLFQGTAFNTNPLKPVIADLDGDNKPDVVTATAGSNPLQIFIFRNTCFPTPFITSVTPTTGAAGTSLTLAGNFMNTGLENPKIKVGSIPATTGPVSNTSVSASIPVGASSDRISASIHGLTAFSKPIAVTFPTSRIINAASFTAPIEFALTNAFVDFTVAADNLTVADLDDDGKTDVVVNDNNTFRIFRNTVASNGAAITTASLSSIATTYLGTARLASTDIDGDGKIDLIASTFIHRNNSGATADAISFEVEMQHIIGSTTGLAVDHDFNRDGKSDFAYTSGNLYHVEENASRKGSFTNTGGGPFSTIINSSISTGAGGGPEKIIADDFDGDGYDDLAFGVNAGADFFAVVRNTGLTQPLALGQFEPAVTFPALDMPYSIASADFDGDGKSDIVLGNNNAAFISIYKNTSTLGSISFLAKQDIAALTRANEVKAVDLDGDGKAEIIVAHKPTSTTGSFTIFQNTSTPGTISFAAGVNYPLTRAPLSLAIADINLDAKPDLIFTTNGTTDALMIFENKINAAPPTITSFSPGSGTVGTTVVVTGTNFSTTPANNIVYFGATQAVVSAATATQLTVTVPVGATFEPITVIVGELIAYSGKSFIPTFPGGTVDACSYAPKVDFTTASAPGEISIADLDGDGKNDLALENGSNISVLRNTSSGPGNVNYAAKIDFITGSSPTSIFTGDLDGDGKLDLVTCNQTSNTLSVYRNTGTSGNITYAPKVDFVTGSRPYSVTIRDLDEDGKADLAIANYGSTTMSVFRNTSSGAGNINFAARLDFTAAAGPFSIAAGDFDADGREDLAVANWNGNSVSVFRNTSSAPGSISFDNKVDFTAGVKPFSISVGDLDEDGKIDLTIANYESNSISVFRNTSSMPGTIGYSAKVDFTTGVGPTSVPMGDLDGDGKVDLAVTNDGSNTVSLFRNTSTGPGSISYATKIDLTTELNPNSVSIGDLDGDGRSDLVVTNFGSNTVSVFRNIIAVAPSITSFSPTNGNAGSIITITGTNFSSTPTDNTVKFFNDVTATVTASTPTSITTTVPAGAATGKISVTVGCNTAISVNNFTVGAQPANQPPVIETATTAVPIEGIITLDLEPLISDPDDNLDVNSLYLVNNVSEQGASANLGNGSYILTLNYGGVQFFGTDRINIGVCDLLGECTQQELIIEVGGDIVVYNAISPDGNGMNETFILQYIDILPDAARNHVSIFNRWGDLVFEVTDYNNNDRVFRGLNKNGKELPSGTYYYKIEFSGGRKTQSGYLSLKR